jgi:CCR4-NOT transcription complex subunit 6
MGGLGFDGLVQGKSHEVVLAVFWQRRRLALGWSHERSRALLVELRRLDAAAGELQPPAARPAPADPHALGEPNSGREERASSAAELLYIVNVHLEASPSRPHDRVAQLRHALQRLERQLQERRVPVEGAQVVIAGDFNSQGGDAPCRLLRDGRLAAGAADGGLPHLPATFEELQHPFRLREAYEVAQAVPAFTRKADGDGVRLDFFFCSAAVEVAAVLRPLPAPLRGLVQRAGLPNRALPSDHLPVGAVLRLGAGE